MKNCPRQHRCESRSFFVTSPREFTVCRPSGRNKCRPRGLHRHGPRLELPMYSGKVRLLQRRVAYVSRLFSPCFGKATVILSWRPLGWKDHIRPLACSEFVTRIRGIMTLKSALQDLRETTLAAVSGLLAKLAYLGSLRRREGMYKHWHVPGAWVGAVRPRVEGGSYRGIVDGAANADSRSGGRLARIEPRQREDRGNLRRRHARTV